MIVNFSHESDVTSLDPGMSPRSPAVVPTTFDLSSTNLGRETLFPLLFRVGRLSIV